MQLLAAQYMVAVLSCMSHCLVASLAQGNDKVDEGLGHCVTLMQS